MSITQRINFATDAVDGGINNAFMFSGGSAIAATVSHGTVIAATASMAAPVVVATATVAGAMIGTWRATTTARDIHETLREKKFANLGHQVPFLLSHLTSIPTFGMMGLLNLAHFVAAVAPASTANTTLAVGAGLVAPLAPLLGITFSTLMGIGSSVLAARSYTARRALLAGSADNMDVTKIKELIKTTPFAFSASLRKVADELPADFDRSKLIDVAKKDNAKQIKKYLIITAVALTMIAAFALMIAFPPGIAAVAIISGILFIAIGTTGLYLNPLRQNDEKYEAKLREALAAPRDDAVENVRVLQGPETDSLALLSNHSTDDYT
ncbi:MAG: hypothetical protein KGZ39_07965 [Simkania sp.]|nr:hypothetical protein [Simkania sp.]